MAAKKKGSGRSGAPGTSAPTIKDKVFETVQEIGNTLRGGWRAGAGRARQPPPEPPPPPTARQVAERIEGVTPRQAATALRSLKAEGRVRSRKVKSSRRLFVFALTGEYMTRESHHRLDTLDKELRAIVKGHEAGDPEMAKELELYLDRMLDELPEDVNVARAEENAAKLVEAARTATKKKEISAHLGFRPYHPAVNTWRTS